jgi:ATP-dependent DNA helicase RecG
MSLRDLALSLRIAGGAEELLKPINVGIMFFNERPDKYFRYARIEVVDKPDPTGIGMVEKYFYGALDVQLSDALNYIKNYIVKEKTFKYKGIPESQRFENFPYNAIEEALTNAVHHRSYQIPEPITVTVTPEYLEILSLPGPDYSITDKAIAEFKMVSRAYRNRRIGEFLKELDMVEARNTGFPRMLHALESNGSPMPILETDENRTYFCIRFNIHPSFLPSANEGDNDGNHNLEKRIIQLMDSNPRTTVAEISSSVSISIPTVERVVRKLKEQGKIKRVGTPRGGHWETLG